MTQLPPAPSRLLLFDLDGTLVRSRGLGRSALDEAFRARWGWLDATAGISFAGATDPLIVARVFEKHGRSAAEARTEEAGLIADYVRRLEAVAEPGIYIPLPGTQALISALSERADCVLAVLTGNVEGGARVKLSAAGFNTFWCVGAFGDEAPARNDLLPVALDRANALGHRLRAQDAVVIGDTPKDIDVARAHGARAVAVATGPCSRDDLAKHTPDALLDDLSHTTAAIAAILGAPAA